MKWLVNFTRGILGATILCSLAVSGCSSLRLPAIDPSGERIFLPAPASTTLTTPSLLDCPPPQWPQPAFTAPPPPPPCPLPPIAVAPVQPVVPQPAPVVPQPVRPALPRPPTPGLLHAKAGREGQLLLSPTRIIAPVGGEVVLLSGLCGKDGYFVTRQPIEWTLSQDSVGQFVEVGDSGRNLLQLARHNRSQKYSGHYAVSLTSAQAGLITRGTPTPNDDVSLQKGQSWISLTSSTEGTSHVTVLASNAAQWDRRRQTATIHWIDAQWVLPTPATVQSGQAHTLVTNVMRNSGGTPAEGWLVAYEIVGEPLATFGNGQSSIEVRTDAAGQAAARLLPLPDRRGAAQVRIQIIRPAMTSGDVPRMVIGEGWTSVTWSAPELTVQMTGPEVAALNSAITYRARISNPGDMTSTGVVVKDVLPPGMELLNSNPPSQRFGTRNEWRFGELSPGGAVEIVINCRAQLARDVRYVIQAESAEGRTAQAHVNTQIYAPALSVRMVGPETAQVGQTVTFQINVTNTGNQRLTNVNATDRFDPGLEHSERLLSQVQNALGALDPGQTVPFTISFVVRQPGRLSHTLEVTADGGHSAVASSWIEATQPPTEARVQVRKTGPAQSRVGEIAQYVIDVTNTGNVPLTNVRVADRYDASLRPELASRGYQIVQADLLWVVGVLQPGESIRRRVNCRCLQPTPAAVNQALVAANEITGARDEARTQIFPAAAPAAPPGTNAAPGGAAPPTDDGGLSVTIAESNDPVKVGDTTTYLIVLRNNRDVSDKNAVVTLQLPAGLRFEKLTGPVGTRSVLQEGRTVVLTPIAELRAGEQLRPFRVEATAIQPGQLTFRVSVSSQLSAQPVVADEQTMVLAN